MRGGHWLECSLNQIRKIRVCLNPVIKISVILWEVYQISFQTEHRNRGYILLQKVATKTFKDWKEKYKEVKTGGWWYLIQPEKQQKEIFLPKAHNPVLLRLLLLQQWLMGYRTCLAPASAVVTAGSTARATKKWPLLSACPAVLC
jgi:hypothetical protein